MRPSEIEILKKNLLERKTKMLAYCSDQRVATADTSLLPVPSPEIEISKKNFLVRKRKCSHSDQIIALASLTPPFHQCDIQISRYWWQIFWTEKQKCSHTVQVIALAPQTTPFLRTRPPEIEISKKNWLHRKTKML